MGLRAIGLTKEPPPRFLVERSLLEDFRASGSTLYRASLSVCSGGGFGACVLSCVSECTVDQQP